MPLTNYTDQALLQELLGAVAYSTPADLYFALSTTTPTQAKGTAGASWSFTEPSAQSQLTAATGTVAITSLAVEPLSAAVLSGDSILVTSGANTQTFVTSAAAAVGATALTITSAVPTVSFPIGSTVQDTTTANYGRVPVVNNTTNLVGASAQPAAGYAVQNGTAIAWAQSTGSWGTASYAGFFDAAGGGNLLGFLELRASTGTLSVALTAGTPVTSLAVTALTIAVSSGATVRLQSGTNLQEFTASAAAIVGATAIAVVSQSPDFAFPIGTTVLAGNPLTIGATTTVSIPVDDFTFAQA